MNHTLIIYDGNGMVIDARINPAYIPVGIPMLWADVPDGYHVIKIDLTGDQPQAVTEPLPPTEIDQLRADLDYVAMMGGVQL